MLERASSPFGARVVERKAHWVEPELVAEVAFTSWTPDLRLRHPSFVGRAPTRRAGTLHARASALGAEPCRARPSPGLSRYTEPTWVLGCQAQEVEHTVERKRKRAGNPARGDRDRVPQKRNFPVKTDNGHEVLAHNSGKMRMHRIRGCQGTVSR